MKSTGNSVLLDAGPLIALYNKEDEYHENCKDFFCNRTFNYILTEAVLAEVIYKIQKQKSEDPDPATVVSSLIRAAVSGIYDVQFLDKVLLNRLGEIRADNKYIPRLDFADLSLVVCAEERNLAKIVTIDTRDFNRLKWKSKSGVRSFEIIDPRS